MYPGSHMILMLSGAREKTTKVRVHADGAKQYIMSFDGNVISAGVFGMEEPSSFVLSC